MDNCSDNILTIMTLCLIMMNLLCRIIMLVTILLSASHMTGKADLLRETFLSLYTPNKIFKYKTRKVKQIKYISTLQALQVFNQIMQILRRVRFCQIRRLQVWVSYFIFSCLMTSFGSISQKIGGLFLYGFEWIFIY